MDSKEFHSKLMELSWKFDLDDYDEDAEDHVGVYEKQYYELLEEGLKERFKESLHHKARQLVNKFIKMPEVTSEFESIKHEAEEYMKEAAIKGCSQAAAEMFLAGLGTMVEQLAYASLSLDYDFDYVESCLRESGMTDDEVNQAKELKAELESILVRTDVEVDSCELPYAESYS
jgi:hypothetical protein